MKLPPYIWLMMGAGLLSALALWFSYDPWGIGVVHDSVFYISGAENFSAGRGVVWNAGGEELRPLVHFPPGYSIVLAAIGGEVLQSASVIQAIALVSSIGIIGGLIHLGSGNWTISVLGAAVAATSPILFERYLDLRSEPIFLVFLLGSIALLLRFLQTDNMRWLWGAGALTAIAGIFRYAGLAAVGASILAVLVAGQSSWKDRVWSATRFALVPTALYTVLAFRNFRLSGSVTNRVFSFHPPSLSVFRQAAVAISEWILPISIDRMVGLSALVAIGLVALILVRRGESNSFLLTILAVYALVYSGSLIVSLTFYDASIRLDNRILLPLYIYFLVAVFAILGRARVPMSAIALASVTMIVIYLVRTSDLIANARISGRGFTSKMWQSSPTIHWLADASPTGTIYSNEALAIYSLLRESAYPAPEKTDPVKGGPREEYDEQLSDMRLRLAEPESALVLFHPDQLREGMPTLGDLTENLELSLRFSDGAIYVDPLSTSRP